MPKSRYDWLDQLKEQKKKERLQKQPERTFGIPIGARYANDTGYGPDGRLQTNRPVARFQTVNGPIMVHEGEQLRPGPNGRVNVVPQQQLIEEERLYGTTGFQQGGTFKPSINLRGDPRTNIGERQVPRQIRTTIDKTGGPTPIPINFSQQQVSPLIAKPDKILQDVRIPDPINIAGPNVQEMSIPVNPNVNEKFQNWMKDLPVQQTANEKYQNWMKDLPVQQTANEKFQNWMKDLPVQETGTTVPDPVGPDVTPDDESQYSESVKYALQQLRKLAEGGSPAQRAAYQKYIDDLKATQATERRVGAQQAAQARVGGVEAETRQLVAARDAGINLSNAIAQAGISDMQARESALNTLAQLGMQGEQLEQSADQWQQQFNFAKQKYGDLEGQRIFADINAGMTYDQIKAKYPQANISLADFDSMKNATPTSQWEKAFGFDKERFEKTFGFTKERFKKEFDFAREQYDFNKQMSSVNTLIQQGGAENFEEASKLFKDMFGQDIDFTNALTEENKDAFNDSMAQMSTYLASGMDWDAAYKAMQADGSFAKLGMSEGDVEKMYNQMRLQSNPIYQTDKALDDLVTSGIIDEEQKNVLMDLMIWSLTNPTGIEVADKYVVYDENGKEVGVFNTQDDANKFVTDNPNKKLSTEFVENHIGISTETGTGTTTPIENFTDFEANIPDEFKGDITQSQWEAAGKPKTWEDYLKYDPTVEITGDLVKGGKLKISKKQLNNLGDAFLAENESVMNKYGVSEDAEITNFLINHTAFPEDDYADNLYKEFKDNKGKLINYQDGAYLIKDLDVKEYKKTPNKTRRKVKVVLVNSETGEEVRVPFNYDVEG